MDVMKKLRVCFIFQAVLAFGLEVFFIFDGLSKLEYRWILYFPVSQLLLMDLWALTGNIRRRLMKKKSEFILFFVVEWISILWVSIGYFCRLFAEKAVIPVVLAGIVAIQIYKMPLLSRITFRK